MKDLNIAATIKVYRFEELSEEDKQLINVAKEATKTSYSPYSNFAVGAAVRLVSGIIVEGSNQENAAFPSGLCAERTTLFYANSRYPDQAVETLAVAAYAKGDFLENPIAPCGACRQVMLETENRFETPVRILLHSRNEIYEIRKVGDLLPLSFDSSAME